MSRDYYIFNNGRLKRKDNTLYFQDEEDNKRGLPIEQIDSIHIYSEVDFNTKMINYISQYGILLNFYNYYGYYTGTFYPRKKNVSGFTLVCQSACYLDYEERVYIAKSFIESAVHHILRNMRYYKVDDELILTINFVDTGLPHHRDMCQKFRDLLRRVVLTAGLASVSGVHLHQVFVGVTKQINGIFL